MRLEYALALLALVFATVGSFATAMGSEPWPAELPFLAALVLLPDAFLRWSALLEDPPAVTGALEWLVPRRRREPQRSQSA